MLRRLALVIVSGLLTLPSVVVVYDGHAGNGGHERTPDAVRLVFRGRLVGFGRGWVVDVDARAGAVRPQ